MKRLYLILAILLVLLVAIPLLAQAEEEPVCTLFLPLVNQPCNGFWFICPSETWPACECPWCLAGERYCVKWNPAGDMVPASGGVGGE